MLWNKIFFIFCLNSIVYGDQYPECQIYNKRSGNDLYLIAESKPTLIFDWFGRFRKIFMNKAKDLTNPDFNDPEQGVWQIIPVEDKNGFYYLRNNLYREDLVSKYTASRRSNKREVYLWPKARPKKDYYPEQVMWYFQNKTNENEYTIWNLYRKEPLYAAWGDFFEAQHNVYLYHNPYWVNLKDDKFRWILKCRNKQPIIN